MPYLGLRRAPYRLNSARSDKRKFQPGELLGVQDSTYYTRADTITVLCIRCTLSCTRR